MAGGVGSLPQEVISTYVAFPTGITPLTYWYVHHCVAVMSLTTLLVILATLGRPFREWSPPLVPLDLLGCTEQSSRHQG